MRKQTVDLNAPEWQAVTSRLQTVEDFLKRAISLFADFDTAKLLGMDAAEKLKQTLLSQQPLLHASDELKRLTTRVNSLGKQSAYYWHLVDAIGFWASAHPGAWPYTDAADCERYLGWSMEFTQSVLDGLRP